MEWHGINLNDHQQRHWVETTFKNSLIVMISIAILSGLSGFIYHQSQVAKQHWSQQQQYYHTQQDKLNNLEQKIGQLKQSQTTNNRDYVIEKEKVSQFIQLLTRLSLKGGLEIAQLKYDEKLTVHLSGQVVQTVFEGLEVQLKDLKLPYNIEQLQTDKNGKLDFHLSIEWEKK